MLPRSVFFVSIIIFTICCSSIALPYQHLVPKAGFVPVYIRIGNTPLSEIHPELAEAFYENQSESPLQDKPKSLEHQATTTGTTTPVAAVEETAVTAEAAENIGESDIASFAAVQSINNHDDLSNLSERAPTADEE